MAIGFDDGTSGDALYLLDAPKLTLPSGTWCIAGWMRRDTTQANSVNYILSYGDFSSTPSFNLFVQASGGAKLECNWKTSSETVLNTVGLTTDEYEDDIWRHFLMGYNGTNFKFYVDGFATYNAAHTVTATTDASTNSGRFSINCRSDLGTTSSEADYVDWSKWDRWPSDGEIAALVAGHSGRNFPKDLMWHMPLVRETTDAMDLTGVTTSGAVVLSDVPRIIYPSAQILQFPSTTAPPAGGRVMSSLASSGGLAGMGGIAGKGGGLAG